MWAVKGAIDDVVLGNLTGLLARIKPAIPETKFEGEKSSKSQESGLPRCCGSNQCEINTRKYSAAKPGIE